MATFRKILERLERRPATVPWRDVVALLSALGYDMLQGKGSACKFINRQTGHYIAFHRPHPENEICGAAKDALIKHLKEAGVLQ